eukprot:3150410-Amphidinium_carterae.1
MQMCRRSVLIVSFGRACCSSKHACIRFNRCTFCGAPNHAPQCRQLLGETSFNLASAQDGGWTNDGADNASM